MFDCRSCFRLEQLPALMAAGGTHAQMVKMTIDLAACKQHQQLNFINAISTA